MAHAPTPPTEPRTGLWGLGFRMDLIGLKFRNIYNDTKEVWLIGKWLSWPFYHISNYFYSARDKSWEADSTLVWVKTWVKGLIEGSTIVDILEVLWFEFRYLRADPVGWVSAKIDQISGELRFLRTDTIGWLRSRLYFAFPTFYALLGNSGWWIYSKLSERYPEIGLFIRDTWGFIRNKVLRIFWWARELQSNPPNAIINWVNSRAPWFWGFITSPHQTFYDFIINITPDLRLMILEPQRWIKEKLSVILGLNYYEMDNFIPSLIKRMLGLILSNYGGLLEYAKQSLCDFILRFI